VSQQRSRQHGGAAMEYVIVSAAALLIAFASVSWVVNMINSRLAALAENTGVPFEELTVAGLLNMGE
jgi:hypothetical protein